MPQIDAWEKEYRNPKLITNSNQPQLDFKHFVKWLKKTAKISLEGLRVLDLGSGTGKNSIFLAERGCKVVGMEISPTAIKLAKERARTAAVEPDCEFIQASIGDKYPFEDSSFNLILDVVSSNSLAKSERTMYLTESKRVLHPGGYMFVKALCKEGDKNAQNLLRDFPGKEKDTYVMPKTGIIERVWSREDILEAYNAFEVLNIERKSSYTQFEGKSYKRNFWLLYLQH